MDWKERVARKEVVTEAVREWQIKEPLGARCLSMFMDGGAMDSHTVFAEAVKTEIPNFAVLGELDDVCSEKDLKDCGFSNLIVILQIGHSVVGERADEVAAQIRQFWQQLEARVDGI